MDISKMTPEQVRRLANQAAPLNHMQFNAHDIAAVMAFEAEKLVKLREALATGQPLPAPQLILMVATRIRELAALLATQAAHPQPGVPGAAANNQ